MEAQIPVYLFMGTPLFVQQWTHTYKIFIKLIFNSYGIKLINFEWEIAKATIVILELDVRL